MESSLSKAIKLARKNGWEQQLPKFVLNTTVIINPDLLDPLFFQSLGKALGWNITLKNIITGKDIPEWQAQWIAFVEHLIAGKNAEEFFINLLK